MVNLGIHESQVFLLYPDFFQVCVTICIVLDVKMQLVEVPYAVAH